jgi:hypothetical protein
MKFRCILLVSAAVLLCTVSISATTNEHSWVSGNGNNSYACSFAAPCLTFSGALAKTTAGGLITAKDAGDFGPVDINQSVTTDGNKLGSITFSGGSNTGINITNGANVTVRNLIINGLGTGGTGIDASSGGIVTVDNCKIMNITGVGIAFSLTGSLTVENSRIESFIGDNVWGIEIVSNAAQNIVLRNTVIDASPLGNYNSGFVVNPGSVPVTASLQNVAIMGAGSGAIVGYSGTIQVTNSVITQSGDGLYADGGTISVASSLITANVTGVCSKASSKIRLDNNDIYDNTTAIANCGGIVKTSGTNKTSGTIAIPAGDVSDSVTF